MVKTTVSVVAAAVAIICALSAAGGLIYSRTSQDRENCQVLNARTQDSNQHIRIPLRESNRALQLIFQTTLRNGPKLDQRELHRLSRLSVRAMLAESGHGRQHDREISAALALKFKGYADQVKLVPPLNC